MKRIIQYFTGERLFLILIVFVFYGNTLKNDYSIDDSFVTQKNNLTAKGIRAIPKIFRSYYVENSEENKFDYRPMVKVSFAIEHELFDVSPKVSHFFNLIFYIACLFTTLSLLRLLFRDSDKRIAFYCVAVFAILPIHTEVVSSIKNRDILLCFLFGLMAFRNYVLFYEDKKRYLRLALGFLFLYMAFLCKFDALPLLAVIPMLVFFPKKISFKWLIIFVVLLVGSFFLFRLTQRSFLGFVHSKRVLYLFENPLHNDKVIVHRFMALFNSLGFYIQQILFPFKQCCYYGERTIPVNALTLHGWLGILATPLLAFALFRSFRQKDVQLFSGLFIFCACISMYLNFVTPVIGIVADRFTFFASLGASIIIVTLLLRFVPALLHPTNTHKAIAAAVAIVFAAMTISRNTDWKNAETLIAADVSKYPDNAYLNYKHGMNLVKLTQEKSGMMSREQLKAKYTEARNFLEHSIQTEPHYPNSRNFLAYVLVYLLNDFNAALVQVNASLAYRENVDLYYYKAICMRETDHKDSTEFYLKKCIAMNPEHYDAYGLLMYDYNAAKQYDKSISMFNEAIRANIQTEAIYTGLAKTYFQMGNKSEAKKYYQEVLTLNPSNQEANAMIRQL